MKRFFINSLKLLPAILLGYVVFIIVYGEIVPFQKLKKNIVYNLGGYGHTYSRFREVKHIQNVDVLVIGSSHAYRGFDPRIFKQHGLSLFNLGTSSQTPIQTQVLLKKYLKRLNPKVVIIEVYPKILCIDGVESELDLISNDGLDGDMLHSVRHYSNIKVINTLLFSIYRHGVFKDLTIFNEPLIKGVDAYVSGGFVERWGTLNQISKFAPQKFKLNLKQIQIFEENVQYIKTLGYKIVLVEAPYIKDLYHSYQNHDMIASFYKKLEVPYYNFNNMDLLNDSLHFYDPDHMNQLGVDVFNKHLLLELKSELMNTKY
jgi:hypothetical protein